jgi:hypothetical protein
LLCLQALESKNQKEKESQAKQTGATRNTRDLLTSPNALELIWGLGADQTL